MVVAPEGRPIEQQIYGELELALTDQYGSIKLASANPMDAPIIDPHLLEDPTDVERLVEGVNTIFYE